MKAIDLKEQWAKEDKDNLELKMKYGRMWLVEKEGDSQTPIKDEDIPRIRKILEG